MEILDKPGDDAAAVYQNSVHAFIKMERGEARITAISNAGSLSISWE
jgi:hypothetical protein